MPGIVSIAGCEQMQQHQAPVQLLNEVVDIEIYRYVRLILSGISCRPSDMGHAMMFVYRGEADIAYPHFLRSYRSIACITLRHNFLELIVVLSGHDPGRRGRDEIGSIQRCDLIHVYVAAEGLSEKALVSLEELPYTILHHFLSKCSYVLHGFNGTVHRLACGRRQRVVSRNSN
jgi:hypothetical protein